MSLAPVPPSVSRDPLPAEARDLPTVCVLCSHNCGLRVDVAGGRITAIRPDPSNPITRGYVCNKAFRVDRYQDHAEHTRHPLRRRPDGRFERISWDRAIREIAERLGTIRAAHGPRSISLVGIGGQANHMNAAYGLGLLRGLGSRRWFNAFAQEKTQHALVDGWMFASSPAAFLHVDQARVRYLVVMGTNPRISNRGHSANDFFRDYAADPDRRLVVVDPRETETTRLADRHLRLRPGTDAFLLLGMAAAIVREGWYDAAFVAERCEGFESVQELLRSVEPAEMAARCGIPGEELVATARELASTEGAGFFYDLGVEQTPFSTLISYLIRLIATVTGQVGRKGGMVFYETFLPPTPGPRPEEPERALASGIAAIPALGSVGMFSPSLFPEEVLVDHPERIRAALVDGANPILSYSDAPRWREALRALDLLVVIEPALTETARLADYVLHRGSVELPAEVDPKLLPGHVWVPNGFGMLHPTPDGDVAQDGVNLNELTDAADRDPITGVPHHRFVRCRVGRAA